MKDLTQFTLTAYASPVNTTPNMKKTAQIQSVTIVKAVDTCPDLSDLDQFENAPKGSEERKYYKADQKRKASYGDTWEMIGIYVKVTILMPSGITQTIRSGGLWGIESDSDTSHFVGTAREEQHELRTDLGALCLNVARFDELFEEAVNEEFTKYY